MNITVFGASGGIGTHVVALAAQRGHQVRAIYRTTPHTPPLDRRRSSSPQTSSTPASPPPSSTVPTW
jgi:uncharacterized protein YbjT (DUF2867 family)